MYRNHFVAEYPVLDYDPSEYVPVDFFQEQWEENKEHSAALVEYRDETSWLGTLSAFIREAAPAGVIFSVIFLNAIRVSLDTTFPNEGPSKYFTNPALWMMAGLFVLCAATLRRQMKLATRLKNSADFAVLESARRYLKGRYGFTPKNWATRFTSYLMGEAVPDNRFSEEYQLVVKEVRGEKVFMVCNIDGEAPTITGRN